MKQIATALVKAQSEMGNAIKGNSNPFFKSKYADLNSVREAVLPILNANGISVIQPMVNIDGRNFVKTVLLHESGELIESFTEIIYNKTNDAQAQGSGITYARRYGLQSLVCVGAEDDDGNAASRPQKKQIKDERANDNLTLALSEVEDSQNLLELTAVFNKWKQAFQTESKFTDACTAKKLKLK